MLLRMGSIGRFLGLVVLASLTLSVLPALSVPLPPTRPADLSSEPASDNAPSDSSPTNPGGSSPLPLCKGTDNRKWDNCVGTFTIENLGEYSGEIRGRKPQGTGVFRALDGSVYQGEFRNGVPSGKGRFTSPKGALYIGEFADGVANGEGSEKAADGILYSGQYANGVRDGKGQLNYPDGRQYEGEFKADRIEGYGTFSFPNGDSYTGVFYNGEPTDRGIFRFANGDRYVGAFKDFKPSGPGVLTFASGIKFIGGFLDGNPKGPGVLYDDKGELIFEGELTGFAAIENAIRDHDTKQKSKQVMINSAEPVAPLAEAAVPAKVSPTPVTKDQPSQNSESDPATKTQNSTTNEIVVSNLAIAPLKSEAPSDGAAVAQIASPAPVIESGPEKSDIQPDPDQSVVTPANQMASPPPAQNVAPSSNPEIDNDQMSNEAQVAVKTNSSPPPLKCKRGGDLIVSFVSCEVLSTQVEIERITFPNTTCRSGDEYLAAYDRDRAARWYDVIRLFKAYFYYRPFDYRGPHRYRDEIHFLVSHCKRAGDFIIRIGGVEWTWPENGEPFSAAAP